MNANELHADIGCRTLLVHAQYVGLSSSTDNKELVIVDLLTSLLHLKQDYGYDLDDLLQQAKDRFVVQQKYPLANIIEGDGTNAPDVAVLAGPEIDSGLLSKQCYTVGDAWADAAQRIADEAIPAMAG